MMNVEQIKKDNPKTWAKLLKWQEESLENFRKEMVKGVSDFEIPPLKPDDLERLVEGTLPMNPRILYEFFDSNGLYVTVGFDYETSSTFESRVAGFIFSGDTRVDIEKLAFEKCFQLLEEKLSNENS